MSKIYITNKKHGCLGVGVPKKIIEVMGWKAGDHVEYTVLGKDKLKIEKVKKEAEA